MRGVFVRNVGVGILALALTVLASCNSDPLSFDVKDTAGIVVTPSYMVLTAGKTTQIFSRTVNQGQEPTYEVITAALDATCGIATLVIEPDNDVVPAEPPGRFDVTAGSVLGTTCITLSGGGATTTVEVVVVAGSIEITNNPGTVRAGDAGTLEARLLDADGNDAGPYDVVATAWTSDNSAVVDVSGGGGAYTTEEVGNAVVTVTWLGQDANGTAGLGVDITDGAPIQVVASVPDSAFFTAGPNLGAFAIGTDLFYDITVLDVFGNLNTVPDEILGVTVVSSNPAAVPATAQIFTDDPAYGAGDVPVVTVSRVAAGAAIISGVVQTSEGDLPYAGAILVVDPTITSVVPATGSFAETVTITGTDFLEGDTQVYVDGFLLGNWTVDSPTQITAQMPTSTSNPPAPVDIYVTTVGVQSPAGPTWTQTIPFNEQLTEDNSFWNTGGQADISVPAWITGTLIGEPDDGLLGLMADWYFFAVSGGTRTVEYENTPILGAEDMQYDVIDGGFNFFWCFDDHTGPGTPDGGTCELPGVGEVLDGATLSTGTWWLIPTEWGNEDVAYNLVITMVD